MPSHRPLATRPLLLFALVALLSVAVKVALLASSQSMADGDESVEWLMALAILREGAHPIYPWGIRYGAAAGLEAHLAALLFALFGVSASVLKSVGLIFWTLNAALIGLVARSLGGGGVAIATVALYGFSPAAAQWSLKVAGGHQVALTLCLLMVLLTERRVRPALIVPLAPLAAFAHPIALPFAALLSVYLTVVAPSRRVVIASLAVSAAFCALLLWPERPPGGDAWNPSAQGLAPVELAGRLLVSSLTFFSPNLSAMRAPSGLALGVSLLWLLGLATALPGLRSSRSRGRMLLYTAGGLGAVLLVEARLVCARHLLLLHPIAYLVMASAWLGRGRRGVAVVALLAVSGLWVQLHEIGSPDIYGAGRQASGVDRAQVQRVLVRLRRAGVAHVYTTEAMLNWVLLFESRGEIRVRGRDPNDRRSDYAVEVDRARREGEPTALVVRRRRDAALVAVLDPDPDWIDRFFPPAPVTAPAPRSDEQP